MEASAPESGVVYVLFEGSFHPQSVRSLLNTLTECANQGIERVHLLLGTQGGTVDIGIETYNILRGMPFELVTHNTGMVASIGVPVYLSGDERLVCPNSSFLLHGITNEVPADQAFPARWFRERHDKMLENEERINAILVDRTKLRASQLAKQAETEEVKGAEAAVKDGIAHRIEEIQIPEDAVVTTVNF